MIHDCQLNPPITTRNIRRPIVGECFFRETDKTL